MNDKLTQLLEKLATKLGTTADYLWKVLLVQAKISATQTLVFVLFVIAVGIFLFRLHKKFSKPFPFILNERYDNILSEMLVNEILNEQFLSKDNLRPKIAAFIKAFVNLKNIPKNYNAYVSKKKQAARLRATEKAQTEAKFWHNIVLGMVEPDEMQKYYKQQDAMLVAKGFKTVDNFPDTSRDY